MRNKDADKSATQEKTPKPRLKLEETPKPKLKLEVKEIEIERITQGSAAGMGNPWLDPPSTS